jgi:hypothetical protein
MRRHIEHTVVMTLGFLLGAAIAMLIAPGDVLLWVVAGVVLGIFARGFLEQSFGGEVFWPFAAPHRRNHAGTKHTAGSP